VKTVLMLKSEEKVSFLIFSSVLGFLCAVTYKVKQGKENQHTHMRACKKNTHTNNTSMFQENPINQKRHAKTTKKWGHTNKRKK
jgi:hypothetical protein